MKTTMEKLGIQLIILVLCTGASFPAYILEDKKGHSDSSGYQLVKKAKGIELYEKWYEISANKLAREVKVAYDWVPVLKALADSTRLRIVNALLTGPRSVNDIVEAVGVSQYNVSKHLRILRHAGIVEVEPDGTRRHYGIVEDIRHRLTKGGRVLDLGCCEFRFDQLDTPKARKRTR